MQPPHQQRGNKLLLRSRALMHLGVVGGDGLTGAVVSQQQLETLLDRGAFVDADEVRAQLEALTVNFTAKSGDTGRLFGSVTTNDVASAIKAAGGPLVEKRAIELDGHIKSLGDYPVRVSLHPDVVATVTLHVVSV